MSPNRGRNQSFSAGKVYGTATRAGVMRQFQGIHRQGWPPVPVVRHLDKLPSSVRKAS
jgi:hypothetical protein